MDEPITENRPKNLNTKKKEKKSKRKTSIFYYDHGEGGDRGGDDEDDDDNDDDNNLISLQSPISPVTLLSPLSPITNDYNSCKKEKENKFDFNIKSKSSTQSSNSSITTTTSSLHITLSINSPNDDSDDVDKSPPPLPLNSPPCINLNDKKDVYYKFDETTATYSPLENDDDGHDDDDNDENNANHNETITNSNPNVTKLNYVQQLKLRFEKLCTYAVDGDTNNTNNTNNYQFKRTSSFRRRRRRRSLTGHLSKVLPWTNLNNNNNNANENNRIHEEASDEEQLALQISDCDEIVEDLKIQQKTKNKHKNKNVKLITVNNINNNNNNNNNNEVNNIYVHDGKALENYKLISDDNNDDIDDNNGTKKQSDKKHKGGKNRNGLQRSLHRPKTEIFENRKHNLWIKSHSYNPEASNKLTSKAIEIATPNPSNSDEESNSAAILDLRRQLNYTFNLNDVPPIIEELLRTEEAYVHNLKLNIKNYGSIFDDGDDLPQGLKGKKYVLFGNIEQIFEFHNTVLLPMLQSNRGNLKQMFDEFLCLLEEDQFYDYILYTINKKKSLNLSEQFKTYFKELQQKLDDKLGINSFLVQPIQRLARYPLLLQEFYKTCFGDIKYKQAIASCCRLEKKMRTLLNTVNECEEINDIQDCFDLNVYYQGHFKKVNEFNVYDYTLKRSYRSKVFIFDKCLIYTEILKEKRLIYRGCYPCEMIGFLSKTKSFTLYYEKRKRQECDFESNLNIIDLWINLIRDMISTFALEEKKKLQEKYLTKIPNDIYRRPNSEIIYRNGNRISADSGISGMTTNIDETRDSNNCNNTSSTKTTWYDTM